MPASLSVDRPEGSAGMDCAGARQQLAHWMEGGQTLLAQISRLCDGFETMRASAEAAERECGRLREELDALQEENAALHAESAGLRAENGSLRAENATLASERREAAQLIADKLEDMLLHVLPRLGRANPAPPWPAAPVDDGGPRAVPLDPDPRPPAPDDALGRATPHTSEVALQPRRILLVDDESDFTTVIREHLVARGHDVLAAASGEEALMRTPDFEPDVIFLDLMMAGIGGMETLRRFRASRPDTPVVIVTALADRDVAKKALAAGAADCLTKPLSLDVLDATLATNPVAPAPAAAPVDPEPVATAAGPAPPGRRTFFARN